jgi:hypothetical protein
VVERATHNRVVAGSSPAGTTMPTTKPNPELLKKVEEARAHLRSLKADADALPDRQVLRPSKRKWTLILLGCVALDLGALWLIRTGAPLKAPPFPIGDASFWLWFGVVLFALGIPLSLVVMFSGRYYLELTRDGFTIGDLVRPRTFRWLAAGPFVVEQSTYRGITTGKTVKFEGVSTAMEGLGKVTELMKPLDRLPDTYGMRAEDLAALMNRYWKAKHLAEHVAP